MADPKASNHKKCKQCQNEGITLFPQRRGFYLKGLEGFFIPRVVRQGYIYILDSNQKWYGYAVSPNGFLKQFNVHGDAPDLPISEAACFATGSCSTLSSCIRIPNSGKKEIETLWVAYSPVKWTKAVIDRHTKEVANDELSTDAKLNNMVEIPVSVAKTGSPEKDRQNAGRYELYSPDKTDEKTSTEEKTYFPLEYFEYASVLNPFTDMPYQPFKVSERGALADYLNNLESQAEKYKHVISVIFDDPAGKLIDINNLMIETEDYYDNSLLFQMKEKSLETLAEKVMLSSVVTNVVKSYKDAISQSANTPENKKSFEEQSKQLKLMNDMDCAISVAQPLMNANCLPEDIMPSGEEIKDSTVKQQGDALDRMLKKDTTNKTKLAVTTWMEDFQNIAYVEEQNKKIVLDQLIDFYYKVFDVKSTGSFQSLMQQMSYNFDSKNIESCASYTWCVQEFIGSAGKHAKINERFKEHLDVQKLTDPENLIGRALYFNFDDAGKELEALIASGNIDKDIDTNGLLKLPLGKLTFAGLALRRKKYFRHLQTFKSTVSLADVLFVPYMTPANSNAKQPSTAGTTAVNKGVDEAKKALGYSSVALSQQHLLTSVFTDKNIMILKLRGSAKEMSDMMTTTLKTLIDKQASVSADTSVMSKNKLRKSFVGVEHALKQSGVYLSNTVHSHVVFFVERDVVQQVMATRDAAFKAADDAYINRNKSEVSRAEAKVTRQKARKTANHAASRNLTYTLTKIKPMTPKDFQAYIVREERYLRSQTGVKGFLKNTMFASCLQLLNIGVWFNDIKKQTNWKDKAQSVAKLGASIMVLVGGIAQYVGDINSIKKSILEKKLANLTSKQGSQYMAAQKLLAESKELKFSGIAKKLGIAGTLIFFVSDMRTAYKSYSRGAMTIARLQFGAGASAAVGSLMIIFAKIPILGWALLAVSAIIGLYLMYIQRSPIQEWLENCNWGDTPRNWSLEFAMEQLDNALNNKPIQLIEPKASP